VVPPQAERPDGEREYSSAVFLWLSKILDLLLLSPLSWTLSLLAAALLLRRRRGASWLLAAGIAVLVAFSLDPVSQALVLHAESTAPDTFRPDHTYDAVVVLGGFVDPAPSRRHGTVEFEDAVDRLLRGFELARAGKARYLLISGGTLWARPGDAGESELVGGKLRDWGIPADRIVLETRSLNTRENAVETARIARERDWRSLLVVTSAMHAPRALACFRAAGLSPDVLPVDWLGGDGRERRWLPRAEALRRSSLAIRELAGRLLYRWLGYAGG
jgi:uncharacterized SAM-binding protein YcdF (DUF218 family)